jgi:hypothetical protein
MHDHVITIKHFNHKTRYVFGLAVNLVRSQWRCDFVKAQTCSFYKNHSGIVIPSNSMSV